MGFTQFSNNYHTGMNEQMDPGKKHQNYWSRLNVAQVARNTLVGRMRPAGHMFVTYNLPEKRSQPITVLCLCEIT